MNEKPVDLIAEYREVSGNEPSDNVKIFLTLLQFADYIVLPDDNKDGKAVGRNV